MADADNQASAQTAVFLSITPGTKVGDASKKFLVMALETKEGLIEQKAITHDDGHLMLSQLVQALALQGCAMAQLVHQMMEEFYDEDEDDEEGGEDEDDSDDEEGVSDCSAPEAGASEEGLTIPEDDYGPDA